MREVGASGTEVILLSPDGPLEGDEWKLVMDDATAKHRLSRASVAVDELSDTFVFRINDGEKTRCVRVDWSRNPDPSAPSCAKYFGTLIEVP